MTASKTPPPAPPRTDPPKGSNPPGKAKPTSPLPNKGAPTGQATAADGSTIAWSTAEDGTITAKAGLRTLLLTKSSGPSGYSETTIYSDLASGTPYLKTTSLVSADMVKLITQSGLAELTTTLENPRSANAPATISVSGRLHGKAVNWTGTLNPSAPTDFVTKLPPAISLAFKDQFRKASFFAPVLRALNPQPHGTVPPAKPPAQGHGNKFVPQAVDGGGSAGSGGPDLGLLVHAAIAFGIVEGLGALKGVGYGLTIGPEGAPIGAVAGMIEALPEAILTTTLVMTAETVLSGGSQSSDGPPTTGSGSGPEGGPDDGPDSGPDDGPDSGPDSGPDAGPNSGPDAGPDSGPDAGPENGPDAGPDAGPESGPEGPEPAGPEPAPEPGPDGPGPDGPGPGPGPDPDGGPGGMKEDTLGGHPARGVGPKFAPGAKPTLPKRKKRS